jgi:hypothetical protein
MNRRTCACLLVAGTVAACGQPPAPTVPEAKPPAEVTTPATTTTTTTTVALPTTTNPPPNPPPKPPPNPPPPPRTTTTTAKPKPPPPPPKPPDRWVLPAGLRGSIEQRASQPFPGVWAGMQDELAGACPTKTVCVGYTLVVDPSIVGDSDCFVGLGGISVPDPLYEGGKITFRVNNTQCPEG